MTDLSEKFESLESQLTTQHTQLMEALAGLGDKLAAIATALEPAPVTGPTLEDVIAAIVAGNAIATTSQGLIDNISTQSGFIATTIGDIHLDTMSMDGKLLTMRDTLADVHLDTMSMDGKLLTMRDDLAEVESDVHPVAQILIDVASVLSLIREAVAPLRVALGSPTGDATTTVLGYLSSLAYSNGLLVVGQDHLIECGCPVTAEGCDHPYSSGDMWLAPYGLFGFESVMVATWPSSPPAGIEYGTLFGLTTDTTELYSADWSGWSVFVESSEPQYAQSLNTDRYPTGVWRPMPAGPGNYTWSVNAKGSLRVTLCAPDAPAPTTVDDPYGYGGIAQRLNHTGPPRFQSQSAVRIGGYAPTTFRPNPNMTLGATLYWHNCYNHTTNTDKSLYLAMDPDDEGSVFLTVPEGETVPWVVNTSESALYVWTYSLPEDNPGHGFALVCAWTAEEAEAHCDTPVLS